ncbi:Acg family FMN-binding oxidoreductase [Actibacterium sp. D379-3]
MPISRRALIGGGVVLAAGGIAWRDWRRGLHIYHATVAHQRARLPAPAGPHDLIRYATLAASGHNAQPWRFSVNGGDGLDIRPDFSRRTSVVDPDDHHLYASLGCAVENLSLAAMACGKSGAHIFETVADGGYIKVSLQKDAARAGALFDAIPHRQSTRTDFDGAPIEPVLVDRMKAAAAHHGVEAIYLSEQAAKDDLLALIVAGNTTQMTDPAFMRELRTWIRFSPRNAVQRGDGLFARSTGSPAIPEWFGTMIFDLAVRAKSENAKYVRQIRSSAGLFVLVAPTDTPEGWVKAGQACQRLALQATADGLKHAFLNQAVEVPQMRRELQGLLGLGDRRPNLVMRVGRGPRMPASLRRPIAQVIA